MGVVMISEKSRTFERKTRAVLKAAGIVVLGDTYTEWIIKCPTGHKYISLSDVDGRIYMERRVSGNPFKCWGCGMSGNLEKLVRVVMRCDAETARKFIRDVRRDTA
jgi:hypothetical protein